MTPERIKELRKLANEGLASDAELFECLDEIKGLKETIEDLMNSAVVDGVPLFDREES